MEPLWPFRPVLVPIVDSTAGFPVRRIYCVGRNYVDHIREMQEGDERDDPFFFQKPTDAVVPEGSPVPYPRATQDFQYEGELVVAIGSPLRDAQPDESPSAIFGYAAGLDLTRRDLQKDSVARSRPWEPGKSFDHSAPCGTIVPRDLVPDISAADLQLHVNGAARQQTRFELMIWSVPEILARLSSLYVLQPGDLVYTGTPAGVGPVRAGDQITVSISGVPSLTVSIADQEN